ncbi:hypothetical protein [uncultured Gammaproteobacteria bacterium]|nr:hypothetical protein [uncultured Gammaproteobacteria bacterium]
MHSKLVNALKIVDLSWFSNKTKLECNDWMDLGDIVNFCGRNKKYCKLLK